jgi:hypothetical protein
MRLLNHLVGRQQDLVTARRRPDGGRIVADAQPYTGFPPAGPQFFDPPDDF